MEELNIKHGPFIVVRRALGIINLICAVSWLFANLGDLKGFDWIYFSIFMISGGTLLTNGFGSEKSFIHAGEDSLKIKWINKFRPFVVQTMELDKITLTRFKVIIDIKGGKPLKLNLDYFERDQKKEVYDYFIEYARNKKVELIRDF